jgi:hypothetical protein
MIEKAVDYRVPYVLVDHFGLGPRRTEALKLIADGMYVASAPLLCRDNPAHLRESDLSTASDYILGAHHFATQSASPALGTDAPRKNWQDPFRNPAVWKTAIGKLMMQASECEA